jgi:hypothetical protein
MSSFDEMEIELNNYRTFYKIAYDSYREVIGLVEDRNQRSGKTTDDVSFVFEKNAAIQRAAMVTVVFSALTIEGFINDYGITRFSKSYFDNHLDKLNTVSKWIILPQLVTGTSLSTDGQAFQMLKSLFKLRDRLVHSKTRTKRVCDLNDDDWIRESEASKAIETVRLLMKEIGDLDETVDATELKRAEKRQFSLKAILKTKYGRALSLLRKAARPY